MLWIALVAWKAPGYIQLYPRYKKPFSDVKYLMGRRMISTMMMA